MKKSFTLVMFLVALAMTIKANPVDMETARERGMAFVNAHTNTLLRSTEELQWVVTYATANNVAALYVFNMPNGFVIVAADDCVSPVLGFSDEGRLFDKNHVPEALQALLQSYIGQIEYGVANQLVATESTSQRGAFVGPLLTTTWGDGAFYNDQCPEESTGPNGHVYASSVAVAMAQIVKYYRYPVRGRGSHSYGGDYGTLSTDFEASEYDFDHMPDALSETSSAQEVNAVAKLISDCGIAVSADYRSYGTGADFTNLLSGLINHFGFSPNMGYGRHAFYTEAEWNDMIRSNIDASMPLLYMTRDYFYGGVCAILDGYEDNGYYHFNFCLNGDYDGWFKLAAIVLTGPFLDSQTAIMNIKPASHTQTVVGQKGLSCFTVSDHLDFHHTFGLNGLKTTFPSVEHECQWVFVPEGGGQLTLDFVDYQDETLAIYDGVTTGHLLRSLSPDNPNNDLSSLVSTGHGLTIVNTSKWEQNGFHLRIAEESDCRMATNINIDKRTSFIYLLWDRNGADNQWKVEYGPQNFTSGEGTVILADTNCIRIPLDDMSATYEFRIQPACDTLEDKLINSIIMNENIHWQDVVTTQPDGYSIDANGTIVISSAEGLAWMAKQGQIDRNVSIIADIDLSAHLWYPIAYWSGNINGNGHVISNMNIVVNQPIVPNSVGLIDYYTGDTIRDLGFVNARVVLNQGDGNAGAIAGMAGSSTTAINCYSINASICSSGCSGGLFGFLNGGLINCYSTGNLYGENGAGGLVGMGNVNMYNCYASNDYIDGIIAWKGLLCSITRSGSMTNAFVDLDHMMDTWSSPYIGTLFDEENTELGYFFGYAVNLDVVRNVVGFTRQGQTRAHIVPEVSLNCLYGADVDLLTALNQGVSEFNVPWLRLWDWDEASGLPRFGDYYQTECPSVSQVTASNIAVDDGFAVALSWRENGHAEAWEIKCLPHGVMAEDSAVYFSSSINHCRLEGLVLGKKYDIYIRPVCNTTAWGSPFAFYVDRSYWTDMVTSCPEGYFEDAQGNVIISTAEGLAWLSVCANGLNGQPIQNYRGKKILIVADLDLGAYRWKPIGHNGNGADFMGDIEGNGHRIDNLSCYEEAMQVGLIGYAFQSSVKNVRIVDAVVQGDSQVGGLMGCAQESSVDNCHVFNVMVKGMTEAGGLIGEAFSFSDTCVIVNSSASGKVYGDWGTGGLVGSNDFNTLNCYANVEVLPLGRQVTVGKGGLMGWGHGDVMNCYSAGKVEFVFSVWFYEAGCSLGSIMGSPSYGDCLRNVYGIVQEDVPIVGSDHNPVYSAFDVTSFSETGMLNQVVTLGGVDYDALFPVLNAWVDSNNAENNLLSWVPDTNMSNGGFPMLGELQQYTITAEADTIVGGRIFGTGNYLEGSTASLTAVANNGYRFVKWTDNGMEVSTNATYSFQVTETNHFVAHFVLNNNGIEETNSSTPWVKLYPNPVGKGEGLELNLVEGESVKELWIVDLLGNVVCHAIGDLSSVNSPSATGVYLVWVIADSGNTYHGRIIVR